MRRHITLLLSLLLAVCCMAKTPAKKQPTVKDLEKQRKATLNQINTTQKLLQETKKNETATVNKLTLLNKSIKERKTLIDGISVEVNALDTELVQLGHQKDSLASRLQFVQADYARLVRSIYYSRSTGNWFTFVLSAHSFNEMFQRVLYLREVSNWRKRQATIIRGLREQVAKNEQSVRTNRETKKVVLTQHKQEHAALVKDEEKQTIMLDKLKKQEKNLTAQQKKQQQKAAQLNQRIEKMIAQEIARQEAEAKRKAAAAEASRKAAEAAARRKAEAEAKAAKEAEAKKLANATNTSTTTKTTTTTTTTTTKTTVAPATNTSKTTSSSSASTLTHEQQLLAGGFESNRGRMPWPVERGVIVGSFGVQPHPTLQHVTINNKGIYIQAPSGSTARAVYEGVVTQRFAIPGSNNAVIVQHGNYRTVYANLTDIYVKVGEKVSAKQKIGKIFTDHENDNKTELYFQLWKDRSVINPAPWLSR